MQNPNREMVEVLEHLFVPHMYQRRQRSADKDTVDILVKQQEVCCVQRTASLPRAHLRQHVCTLLHRQHRCRNDLRAERVITVPVVLRHDRCWNGVAYISRETCGVACMRQDESVVVYLRSRHDVGNPLIKGDHERPMFCAYLDLSHCCFSVSKCASRHFGWKQGPLTPNIHGRRWSAITARSTILDSW